MGVMSEIKVKGIQTDFIPAMTPAKTPVMTPAMTPRFHFKVFKQQQASITTLIDLIKFKQTNRVKPVKIYCLFTKTI